MQIGTERLILRTIKNTDAKDIYEYSKQENVGVNAGWKPHESIEETKEIMDMIFTGKEGVFGIVLKNTGKIIGSIGLIDDPKRENPKVKMLGYALSEDYWGIGIMTEAAKAIIKFGFNELNIDMISAYCYPHNKRSKAVLEKCGFIYEATLRKCELLYDGNLYDNECYYLEKNN